MAAFDYEALDSAGKRLRGTVTADSPRLARRELRRQNLLPVALRPMVDRKAAGLKTAGLGRLAGLFTPRLAGRELSLVTRQLATLVSAAAPVEEAVQTVGMQAEKPAIKRILMSVRAGVTEGQSLSRALAQHPRSFPPLYRAMVAAGEESGGLGPVLERLADHLEKSQKVRAKAMTALVYPAVLALTAVGVVVALMLFVVPKVVEQFESMGRELPALTRLMITLSDAVRDWGLAGLLLFLLALLAGARALRRPAVRQRADGALLRLPLVGKLLRGLETARLTRTLGALIASGSPVVDALGAARATVANSVLREAVDGIAVQVREGASLSGALRRADRFPPVVTYMAAMGERSGTLGPMLEKCADHLEAEFDTAVSLALSLLEPAIIVAMGGVVATIILSILLPIIQFNTMGLA